MARFFPLILGALVWLAFRSCHADGRVFVLEMQNASETGHEWAQRACAAHSARLASVADLWHAILECSFAVCTRGWMDGATVGTTICKSENGAGLRTVDVKVEDDVVEEEERRLDAFCVKDKEAPCGAPPIFPHTHMQSQTGLELGDELVFECEAGFSFSSGDTAFSLLCDSCGEWYGHVQLCAKDEAEAHVDYEDKFPDGDNSYSDSEDGASQAAERGGEEEVEENGETPTEEHRDGAEGETGEGEEEGDTAGGDEEGGESDVHAGSVTDPPVSLLSQKHLFWFPSEAFHDDEHVDTHASDHKHSGAKETDGGVEDTVDQESHSHDHTEEEHMDDHIKEEHTKEVHHIEDHTEEEHIEEEHNNHDHAEEEHIHDHPEEEHNHDHTEEEHNHDHIDDHTEEEHTEEEHIEEVHHSDDHTEEEHIHDHTEEEHIHDHTEEEHTEEEHIDDHTEEEHTEEEHSDDHIEEVHIVDHSEEEHHSDDHSEEEPPTDEVLQLTDKSWLDGHPIDEEFTKSTEIGSEEEGMNISKEHEESVTSEEYEKAIDSSEETFKGVIEQPGATDMYPTFFTNASDVTTAPFLHTIMESLNGDGADSTTPSGVGPYDMTLDTTATTVVYGSTGTTIPELFHHASLPTDSNDATAFVEDITSVPFHVTLSPDDVTDGDDLGSPPALTTVLPDDLISSLSTDVPVLIHDISGVDSDHHNLTKQSAPTEEPCELDACPSSRSSSLIAIITVGTIVAVVGLALGAWLYRRRQRKSSHYQFNGTNSHTQNFEMQQTA